MIDTKLVMLEGLAGTGKSTNSHMLLMQLERSGCKAKWIHEVARPHPTLFFSEACLTYDEFASFLSMHPQAEKVLKSIAVYRENSIAIDLLDVEWNYVDIVGQEALRALQAYDMWHFSLDRYSELAIEKWRSFTERALTEQNTVYILDSSIFQYQIFTFLLKNEPYEVIERFVKKLMSIVTPLNPMLFYLHRRSIDSAIDYLIKSRGTNFIEGMWERDKHEPYYNDKPRSAQAHIQFLRDYADIAMRLFNAVDCNKSAINISNNAWVEYEDSMLGTLGIARTSPPDCLPVDGVYRNDASSSEIVVEGLTIREPEGSKRILIPKSRNEFYVECLPVVLCFDEPRRLTIGGGQICARWTTSGMVYEKITRGQ